jgi:hypothetical protein
VYESSVEDTTKTRLIPSDTADLPERSHGDEFVSLLKLTGVIMAILGLVWAIAYFDAG